MNQFLKQVRKKPGSAYTQNMAVSHGHTGSELLDYFANAGSYRDRSQGEVDADMAVAWAENPELTLKLLFHTRMITRKVMYGDGRATEKVQRGMGNRDESRKMFNWVARNHPDVAVASLPFWPLVGTWKDLWHMDLIDVLPRQAVYNLIAEGIEDSFHRHLIAKYLPQIRSKASTSHRIKLNEWARGFVNHMGWSEKEYRKFKAHPKNEAHKWQRQACAQRWEEIEFETIPGIALFRMVTQSGRDGKNMLERHNQNSRYLKWLEKQPVAKFNGYPYELAKRVTKETNMSRATKMTLNKQFENLLQTSKRDGVLSGNVWCAVDTSGSMSVRVAKDGTTAYDVCVGLAVYFSALNEGAFKDNVIMFDTWSQVAQLTGNFVERVKQFPRNAMGDTNFQSVIEEIVRIRRENPTIPIEDYPETLLVVSDMQFNPAGGYSWGSVEYDPVDVQTNYQVAMDKLKNVGLPEITVIWWQVNGRYGNDFPVTEDTKGTALIAGFDGSTITMLLGGSATGKKASEMTPYEQMVNVLDQEILNRLVA